MKTSTIKDQDNNILLHILLDREHGHLCLPPLSSWSRKRQPTMGWDRQSEENLLPTYLVEKGAVRSPVKTGRRLTCRTHYTDGRPKAEWVA